MRIKLAAVGATAVALALLTGQCQAAVLALAAYVVWMYVRIPIERRARLRQVDPTWHRGRHYDTEGNPTDDQE